MPDNTFTFTTPDGVEIFVRKWTPSSAPKAAVQIVHGAAEHSARYDRFARFLNDGGYLAYATDHRGHGQSISQRETPGVTGPDAWNSMVRDQKQLTDIIQNDHPALPIFLFGHSMGSFMAQDYMERWGGGLKGVVLSGTNGVFPNLDAIVAVAEEAAQGEAAGQPSAAFGQMFAGFNTPFEQKTGFEWLSRDPDEVQKYVDDPLCGFPFSNALTRDFMAGLREIWRPENEARIPKSMSILVVSGALDPVGGNTLGIMPLIDRYRALGIADLQFKFYPGARHEILNETNRDEVQADIRNWMDSRL